MTFALVQTTDDLLTCPQLTARDLLRVAQAGGTELHLPGRPFRIDGTSSLDLRPAPPQPGSDTADVLGDWLDQHVPGPWPSSARPGTAILDLGRGWPPA